jgi:hypothetical protein
MVRSVDSSVSTERRALEHAVRERARAEADVLEVRILREHRAKMAAMAERHAVELEAARERADRRRRRNRRWGGALLGLWLAGFGLAFAHARADVSPSAATEKLSVELDTCGWSSAQAAERARLEQRLAQDDALVSMPPPISSEPAAVEKLTPPPRVAIPAPPARVAQPAPPPREANECEDASGDPCCAFGEIVC